MVGVDKTMDGIYQGVLGGIVPAAVMIIIYFVAMAGRLAKIETNICWLKKIIEECLPHSKNHSH